MRVFGNAPAAVTPQPAFGSTSDAAIPALTIQKLNPANAEPLTSYTQDTPEQVTQKADLAKQTLEIWRQTSLKLRALLFMDVVKLIRDQVDQLARLITAETGKPVKESLEADIASATSIISYYAKQGPKVLKDKRVPLDKSAVMARFHSERRVPRGVVGVISPWNFPFAIPISGIAAALMGGNTVLLKPSEMTMGTGEAIVNLFQTALQKRGLPKEIVQLVQGDRKVGQALLNEVDYVIFTGSETAGKKIRETVQARGKEASLELGGSDPMVILDSADLDIATSYALWGRYANAGQMCAAVKRLIVPADKSEQIVSLLKTKIAQLNVGDPLDPKTHMGPVISQRQRDEVHAQVQDALSKGAQLITGGKAIDRAGYYYEPTLLLIPAGSEAIKSRVMSEEVFGPVLPVVTYNTVDEAVAIANNTRYGLTASVFGKPGDKKLNQVASRLEAGSVMINDVGATNFALPSVPWAGWKNSGPGTAHHTEGLLDTTLGQTITENWMMHLPGLKKQPWHFSKDSVKASDEQFSKELVKGFGSESIWEKLKPGFWLNILKHRSSKKI